MCRFNKNKKLTIQFQDENNDPIVFQNDDNFIVKLAIFSLQTPIDVMLSEFKIFLELYKNKNFAKELRKLHQ